MVYSRLTYFEEILPIKDPQINDKTIEIECLINGAKWKFSNFVDVTF